MSENDELVKRLRELLQADLASTSGPIEGSLGMLAVMPFPQFDRITDERKEAAQAIERLEAQTRISCVYAPRKEDCTLYEGNAICVCELRQRTHLAERELGRVGQQLADARAEIERLKDTAREALQTLEAAAGRMPYGKRYDNVAARIIATQERVREALAAPAPGKDSEKVTKP